MSLGREAFALTSAEAARVFGDLVEIALHFIPDERKPLFADEIRAYAAGERSLRPATRALSS